jgi:hypothetical protein
MGPFLRGKHVGAIVVHGNPNCKESYWGTTTIGGGTLVAGAAGALSPSSDMSVSGGTLDASGYANTVKSLTVTSGGGLDLGIGELLTSSGAGYSEA